MRCGILIIGSLLWDDGQKGQRAAWRAARLVTDARVPVQMPIYYGRKSVSRGDTYTMVFGTGEPTGQAVLVPCTNEIKTLANLIEEASALWCAEDANAQKGSLYRSWGSIGAVFGQDKEHVKLSADWTAYFRKAKARCVSVVSADGLLDIKWPDMLDSRPAEFDVILATATKPDTTPPAARVVAEAWADQCGNENYFFNNVLHGIRTLGDGEIWRWIEERSPCWLKKKEHQAAIELLRSEAANSVQD